MWSVGTNFAFRACVSQVKISTFSSPGSRSGIGIGRHKPRGASLQFGGVVAPTGAARGPLLLGRTPHEAAGWRPITRVSGKSGALGSPRTAAPCPHHGVRPARPTAARFCSAKRRVRGVCCSCRFGPRVRPSRWLSRLRLRRISMCLCSIGPAWALGGKYIILTQLKWLPSWRLACETERLRDPHASPRPLPRFRTAASRQSRPLYVGGIVAHGPLRCPGTASGFGASWCARSVAPHGARAPRSG